MSTVNGKSMRPASRRYHDELKNTVEQLYALADRMRGKA